MRALVLGALLGLSFASGAAAQMPLALCQQMDPPACAAWAAAVVGPLAVLGLGVATDELGAAGVGIGLGVAALAVGPAAGFVVAGHGREAIPGLALRAGAVAATVGLALAVGHPADGLGGGMAVGLFVLGPGLAVLLLSDRHDTRRLRELLQSDARARTSRRPAEVSLVPARAGTTLRLALPL